MFPIAVSLCACRLSDGEKGLSTFFNVIGNK